LHPVNLYSDTQTRPTDGTRAAIANAEVGDEQRKRDPTTRVLQERVAALLGHEAAVFLPSGTMCNEIAFRIHVRPGGDEIILDRFAHPANAEAGGPAQLAGAMLRTLDGEGGIFTPDQLTAALRRPGDRYLPRSRVVSVEQTTNAGGGRVWPLEIVRGVLKVAREHDLRAHLDGARLMNAVVATGHPARDWARHFDTVSICFSKGLGAPVGSALAGSAEAIRRARRLRKLFGGGMRQAGILAAGALHALEHQVDRLEEDHRHAQILADAFQSTDGFAMESGPVETNLVWVAVDRSLGTAAEVAAYLRSRGILVSVLGPQVLRACTHLDVTRQQVELAAEVIRQIEPAMISAMTLVY
jgi:threonine aldolase